MYVCSSSIIYIAHLNSRLDRPKCFTEHTNKKSKNGKKKRAYNA